MYKIIYTIKEKNENEWKVKSETTQETGGLIKSLFKFRALIKQAKEKEISKIPFNKKCRIMLVNCRTNIYMSIVLKSPLSEI